MSACEYTTFNIPGQALYPYNVILIDKVIPGQLKNKVFVYIDDLLVISVNFDSYIPCFVE